MTYWVLANAFGLGLAYGLFALFGDIVESMGADHGGVAHGLSALSGLVVGGALFVTFRDRATPGGSEMSRRTALATEGGLAVGFVVGLLIAGPPLDFVLGILTLGTIGAGLQWRINRGRVPGPGGLLAIEVVAWLAAAVAALIVAGDGIDALAGGGTAGFVGVTFTVGFVAGLVGSLIEGPALRRRLGT